MLHLFLVLPPSLCLPPQEPEEGTVWRKELGVGANGGLIVGAHPCHELCQAFLTDGVSAAEADREESGRVVAVSAHGALEEVRPVGGLHGESRALKRGGGNAGSSSEPTERTKGLTSRIKSSRNVAAYEGGCTHDTHTTVF